MKRIIIILCLLSFLFLPSCTSKKNVIDQSVSEAETATVDLTDTEEQQSPSQTDPSTAENDPTSEIRSDVSSESNSKVAKDKPSEQGGKVETPQSAESGELPSPEPSAAPEPSPSSPSDEPHPQAYRAEDLSMTYAQMEDRFRSYAESRGLVYDASLTVKNAGFTGRVTSFEETWESFYQAVIRWMEEDISMYSPRAVRVQLVRSEDDTFEYAYVLWM